MSAGRSERPPAPEPLPHPLVDDHTHLDLHDDDRPGSAERWDVARALDEAAAVGVARAVQVAYDLPSSRATAEVVAREPRLLGAVALHPNEAPRLAAAVELDDALAEVASLAGGERVRAVGETGLDHYRTGEDGRAAQEASFRAHLAIAREAGLAVQIHDRDAHADVLRVLDDAPLPDRVVFHCFSGDAAMARHCVERGWYLSFAGTVTFRNADGLRAALREVPLGQVLLETDAPYLTPHPHRGRANSPYLLPLTARAVAAVLERPLEEVCAAVWRTAEDVYGSWAAPAAPQRHAGRDAAEA